MVKPLSQARNEYRQKFPLNDLLDYNGTLNSCSIRCCTHGEVVASSFNNVIRSKYGCPLCGKAHSQRRMVESNPAKSSLSLRMSLIDAINNLPAGISDAEYRSCVLQILDSNKLTLKPSIVEKP